MMKIDIVARYETAPTWLRYAAVAVFIISVLINVVVGNFGAGAMSKYNLFVTPPHYVFLTSWTLISLVLLAVLVYSAAYDIWPQRAYWASIAAGILNAILVGLWSVGSKNAIAASLFIALGLFAAVAVWWYSLYSPSNTTTAYYAMRNAVAFYEGWVLIVTVLTFGVVLVHTLGVSQKEFTTIFWILTPLAALLVIGVKYWFENMHAIWTSWGFWLAIFWGFFGALIANIKSKEGFL
jgi:hypothetical protein